MSQGSGPAVQRAPLGPGQAFWLLAVAVLYLQLPKLAPLWLSASLLVVGLFALFARGMRLRWLALALLAIGWTGSVAQLALQSRWSGGASPELLVVDVRVQGLPEQDEYATRFAARVVAAPDGHPELVGERLQISWFGPEAADLAPGEQWRLPLRLRPPRGLRNPGGFDFERHALAQRIVALGSVAGRAERIAEGGGLDALRARLAELIAASGAPAGGLLRALAVGDTRALDDAAWDRLRATGLSHLFAISGLHIGLVAGLAALLMRGLYWLRPGLGLRLALPQGAALAAISAATAYAALAGLSLPTLRTLIMLAAVLLALLLRRQIRVGQSLALAALLLWVLDPLALLTPGFWLSLGGVFWLLACVPRGEGWRAASSGLLRAQLVLGLALLPLSVLFFGGSSLVGLPLNLLAVPWVTMLVVPPLLLGLLCLPLPLISGPLLALAGQGMEWLWQLAGLAADLPAAYLYLPEPSPWAVCLALAGLVLLLAPRGVPGRSLAALLLLPLLLPARPPIGEGAFRIDMLDVGQGLAVLVRTESHGLLYDAGARSRGGFDLGDAVVVPALRALGLGKLDRVMVSHGDIDHAGGLGAVLRAYPDAELWTGEPGRVGGQHCQSGADWEWDGVRFALLHPPRHFPALGNESSCVLAISGAGGRALLPGDIGEVIEGRLLREQGSAISADLLLVPHHGSRSSSSPAFVSAVAPRWAAISAGAGNRFGHPHAEVTQRYLDAGARILPSARHGRISWLFASDGARIELIERRDRARFWQIDAP